MRVSIPTGSRFIFCKVKINNIEPRGVPRQLNSSKRRKKHKKSIWKGEKKTEEGKEVNTLRIELQIDERRAEEGGRRPVFISSGGYLVDCVEVARADGIPD